MFKHAAPVAAPPKAKKGKKSARKTAPSAYNLFSSGINAGASTVSARWAALKAAAAAQEPAALKQLARFHAAAAQGKAAFATEADRLDQAATARMQEEITARQSKQLAEDAASGREPTYSLGAPLSAGVAALMKAPLRKKSAKSAKGEAQDISSSINSKMASFVSTSSVGRTTAPPPMPAQGKVVSWPMPSNDPNAMEL